jgi:hypothetical protein
MQLDLPLYPSSLDCPSLDVYMQNINSIPSFQLRNPCPHSGETSSTIRSTWRVADIRSCNENDIHMFMRQWQFLHGHVSVMLHHDEWRTTQIHANSVSMIGIHFKCVALQFPCLIDGNRPWPLLQTSCTDFSFFFSFSLSLLLSRSKWEYRPFCRFLQTNLK